MTGSSLWALPAWVKLSILLTVLWASSLAVLYHRGILAERRAELLAQVSAHEARDAAYARQGAALRDSLRAVERDAARLSRKADSLTQRQERAHSEARLIDSVTIQVRDTFVTVPPEIPRRLVADSLALVVRDSLVTTLRGEVANLSGQIRIMDARLAQRDSIIATQREIRMPPLQRSGIGAVAKHAVAGYVLFRALERVLLHR